MPLSMLRGSGAGIDALPSPFYAAHRGNADFAPENSLEAIEAALAEGATIIDVDAYLLSDGSVGVMHDATVTRTTTSTANTADLDRAGWDALVVDSANWFGSGYGNISAPFLEEVLQAVGDRAVISIEPKNSLAAAEACVALLLQYGLQDNAIINSFFIERLAPAVANGVAAMFLSDSATPATVVAAGVTHVGVSTSATDPYIASLRAVGLKVNVYTLRRKSEASTWLAKPVDGIYTDDSTYLSGTSYRTTTDPFDNNKMYHGQLGNTVSSRGTVSGGKLVLPSSVANVFVLQGWGCPIANAAGTYSITYEVTYDSISSDATRWTSVGFCFSDDKSYDDSARTGVNGYNCILRINGSLQMFKITNGSSVGQIGSTGSSAAITAGTTATLRVDVTPTSVTVTRTDVDPDVSTTSTDTTYRGGYFFLNKQQTAGTAYQASFANVEIA